MNDRVNTVSDAALADRLSRLPAERQRVFRHLLAKDSERPLGPRPAGAPVPLTFGQQRLWLLDRLVPGNCAYNETNYLRFPYAVDVDALRFAINEIVRRHEILRTCFQFIDEQPRQVVAGALTVDIPLIDLRQLPAHEREAEALRLAAERSRVPFDLAQVPLVRASIYRLDGAEFLLAVTLHHIVCDGWSLGVLVVELLVLYLSRVTGKPSPLPNLPVQYGDFAVWQRQSSAAPGIVRQLSYWRRQLADLPRLDLPADRPRPAEFTFRGARQPLHISATRHDALRAFCKRENVTVFTVLLAAFYVLLHRYSGQDDLPVGSPIGGRHHKQLEPLIGHFVNPVVLRANLAGNPRFVELLAGVRDMVSAALANQDVAFDRIVEELQPARDKSRNPLFQITFQVFEVGAPGFAEEAVPPFVPVESGISKFDLAVELGVRDETALEGHIEYNTDLFDAWRIERLAAHYLTLLDGILADPSQRVSELPMLTREELHQLDGWNHTSSDYPRDKTIPQMFAAVAAVQPAAAAVRFGNAELSYRELSSLSDRVAHHLLARGVSRGEPVAVFLERGLDMPAVLLGILKAGAAFVPLDPGYPPARLSHMLSASGARHVVSVAAGAAQPPFAAEMIDVSAVLRADAPIDPPPLISAPEDIAYIMYTSGSTGVPKGVAVTHRNILRTVLNVRYLDWGQQASVLQFSSTSFDASTFEIWGSLLNGGVLVLHPPDSATLDSLGRFIADARIDILFMTTALFREMVERCPDYLRSVGQILTGGEAMRLSTAKAAWVALPRSRLANVYGPTECTTFATSFPITDPELLGGTVPIGRPIDNTSAFLLDRYGNRVPVGIPGELYLGGDGVAQGYWREPELTAESFVPDRFSGADGGRLYRTGDLAAFRPDGNIVFLGRRDRQIKLSGYRIELEEIEAVLEGHPDVAKAAVVVTGDDPPRLVAFVAASADARPTDLRDFLMARLPAYMVPAQVQVCDELPLTPTGKLDRAALEQQIAPVSGQGGKAPPRTATEIALANMWQELLRAEGIGLDDNFFDLGGHSLAATRLLSRVRDRFRVDVTMRSFFDRPTVGGLAELISAAGAAAE
jgi:amino acid adenylation domain-containing protein